MAVFWHWVYNQSSVVLAISCSTCCVCDEVGGEIKKEKLSKTKIPWELSLSFHDTYACGGAWTVLECLSGVCEIKMLCCLLEDVCVVLQTQTILVLLQVVSVAVSWLFLQHPVYPFSCSTKA